MSKPKRTCGTKGGCKKDFHGATKESGTTPIPPANNGCCPAKPKDDGCCPPKKESKGGCGPKNGGCCG